MRDRFRRRIREGSIGHNLGSPLQSDFDPIKKKRDANAKAVFNVKVPADYWFRRAPTGPRHERRFLRLHREAMDGCRTSRRRCAE